MDKKEFWAAVVKGDCRTCPAEGKCTDVFKCAETLQNFYETEVLDNVKP